MLLVYNLGSGSILNLSNFFNKSKSIVTGKSILFFKRHYVSKLIAIKKKTASLEELAFWQYSTKNGPERAYNLRGNGAENIDKKRFRTTNLLKKQTNLSFTNKKLEMGDRFYCDNLTTTTTRHNLDLDSGSNLDLDLDLEFLNSLLEIGEEDYLNKLDDYFRNFENYKNLYYQNKEIFESQKLQIVESENSQRKFLDFYGSLEDCLPRAPLEHSLFMPEGTFKLSTSWMSLDKIQEKLVKEDKEEEDLIFMCYLGLNKKEHEVYETGMFAYDKDRFKKKSKKIRKMLNQKVDMEQEEASLYNKSPFVINICCKKCL